MKKSFVILLHVGYWVCYLLLIMVILGLHFEGRNTSEARMDYITSLTLCISLIPAIIAFYAFYFWVFPSYLKHKKVLIPILYGAISSVGAAIIAYPFLRNVIGGKCSTNGESEDSFWGGILFMSIIGLLSGIIALVIQGCITWIKEIKLKETLAQKTLEMELALVKSQLDPHFLFNTLNNIDVLILKDAEAASNYLNKLSDIMRFMLFETKTAEISLSKEIEYIEKYIELQKIRTANSNYVKFLVTGVTSAKTIAPMIFIPFIENAFKHTTNKKLDNAISIHIIIKKETTELVCINKFNANAPLKQESNGLGNELIKKRLNLIYPEKHSLKITNQDDVYSVYLSINNG